LHVAKLPVISGKQAIAAFEQDGWVISRQRSSHVTMKKPGCRFLLSVPLHKELDRGTLRRLVRDCGLTVDEFAALLGK
jgi:predicted RNA binding protein YcfA (HicA-like mRNA interferase family)